MNENMNELVTYKYLLGLLYDFCFTFVRLLE